VAAKLTVDADLQKDVLQEMVIHLAAIAHDRPGQTNSWYIKSCEFRARNYLNRGRSIDSYKRSRQGVSLTESDADRSGYGFCLVESCDPQDLLDEISARDIVSQLNAKLTPLQQRILALLLEGMGVREVARHLKLSHPVIIKHRRKIARLAAQMLASPVSA
jgi:DNA-binding CsgD family transcriptional regulator